METLKKSIIWARYYTPLISIFFVSIIQPIKAQFQEQARAWGHLSTRPNFEYQSSFTVFAGFSNDQRWIAGDFNGDGMNDLANVYGDNDKARAWVHLSTGSGFEYQSSFTVFAGFSNNQRWVAGDFNGDGMDDLANVYGNNGKARAWVHLSTGSGFEYQSSFTTFAGFSNNQRWIAGDFNGDGMDDLANVYGNNGKARAWVHLSTGSGFEHKSSFTVFAGFSNNQRWVAGDFNGDGMDDLANVYGNNGKARAWVHLSTGSGFEYKSSFTVFAGFSNNQRWVAGDFNGDGMDDLANVYGNNGKARAWVHLSTGSGFEYQSSFTVFAGFSNSQRWVAGDFNGDGMDDLANVYGKEFRAHNLQIRRFNRATLTNAHADAILQEASNILQTDDGGEDVSCPVWFRRSGNVTAFNVGNGVINSQADFNTVNNLDGNVKIVTQINWCGGISPGIIGCAPVPGNSFVAVRLANLEGILWAHEFGHNQGLGHRNDPNAIMNGTLGFNHRRVTSSECNAYRRLDNSLVFLAASSSNIISANQQQSDSLQIMDVKDFVRQLFIHGVPYEEASKYSSEVVPVLVDMLSDTTEQDHWSNIVVTLAITGDEQALDSLIAFIEKDQQGKLADAVYNAKASAIISLGYHINRSGNKKALAFLKNCLSPGVWTDKNLKWISPFQKNIDDRNTQLSMMAILGLALSGHPEAKEALLSLKQPTQKTIDQQFRSDLIDFIDSAIKEHEKIAKEGIIIYQKR